MPVEYLKFSAKYAVTKAESLVGFFRDIGNFGESMEYNERRYTSVACELSLTDLASTKPGCYEIALKIALNKAHPLFLRVNAFYFCGIIKRLMRDPDQLRALLYDPRVVGDEDLLKNGTYYHLQAYYLTALGGSAHLRRAVDFADLACKRLPENAGTLHQFAYTVVVGCEEGFLVGEDRERLLSSANERLGKALEIFRYPQYLATRGRLCAIRRMYGPAKDDLRLAILLARREYPKREKWPFEIYEHLYTILVGEQIDSTERKTAAKLGGIENNMNALRADWEKTEESIRSSSTRSIEVMVLFAAIISLLIAGITISTNSNFDLESASKLLITLLGLIMTMQTVFMFLLSLREAHVNWWKWLVFIFFIGSGVILSFRLWERV